MMFSSTLIALIAVIGIMSLFSIWSMNRAYIENDKVIEQIHALAEEGLLAQIDFKVQVQEWKNVLLRGSDKPARAKYLKAFDERKAGVEQHLSNLVEKTAYVELLDFHNRAKQLILDHRQLNKDYRQALAGVANLNLDNARKVDNRVLGIDRDLEVKISELSESLSGFSKHRNDLLVEQLVERYKTLRLVMLLVISFALVVTVFSLYGALASTKD
jgi:methyl-accepting chemotaxis protein